MNPRKLDTYFIAWVVSLFTVALLLSSPAAAEPGQFIVSPIAEKKTPWSAAGTALLADREFPDTRPGAKRCGR